MEQPHGREALARQFGSRLKELCQARGWSQRELGRRTKLRPYRLSRLIRGLRPPSFEEILLFREVFATGLEELVFGASPEAQEILELARGLIRLASREEEAGVRSFLRKLLAALQQRDLPRGPGSC